ncbi:MAG: hypothetical protein C5B49_16015 [Bdellovibrio sp.]|nr:MAG: hypothetical protein C5B49_16015 [Bdellovibrio sp.]
MFDAIIIGARVAGSTLALQLARQGRKVFVIDKMRRGQDTLSTHFVWPRGASYLNRMGLLDKVLERAPSATRVNFTMENFRFSGEVSLDLLAARYERLHGTTIGAKVQQRYFSARRKWLDTLLIDAAMEAGAEVRLNSSFEHVIRDADGRPMGIEVRSSSGKLEKIFAPLIVGADGKRSSFARQMGSIELEPRRGCSFACFSYFTDTGLPLETHIQKRGRLALAHCATNDGAHMVLLFGPESFNEAFGQDREHHFLAGLKAINSEIAEQVRQGRRVEPFYSTADQAGFIRNAAGPGFALIGDAACFKDQCTASGMTHALRDSALLADLLAIDSIDLQDRDRLDRALAVYQQKRIADSSRYYDFVCLQAEMNATRPDELQLFEALQADAQAANRFVALYGDTLPVRDFFSEHEQKKILRSILLQEPPARLPVHESVLGNPFLSPKPALSQGEAVALSRNCVEFATPPGADLLNRVEDYYDWYRERMTHETFQYSRTLETFPGPRTRLVDDSGRAVKGINFASQDYLAMGQHPAVRQAGLEALQKFGPHSAGSPMIIGNTSISRDLEGQLGAMLKMREVVLFPTGWAAGYGSIVSLVRPQDHIVMDRLSHSCLQQGAYAATKNIQKFPHLDYLTAAALLRDIRSRDQRNGIMVITEGIFSMDADSPDIRAFQRICRENGATLLIDVAHDFGGTGPQGGGQLALQGMLGEVDLVMGSFSKSFAANGGFLATHSPAVKQYVKMYSSSHLFSNALSPMQTAVALTAARIMVTPEGDDLRAKLMRTSLLMRSEFANLGLECRGQPGPIIPVMIGEEKVARVCHRILQKRNIAAMIIEYPLVAVGTARLRLQIMASHEEADALTACHEIAQAVGEARDYCGSARDARFNGESVPGPVSGRSLSPLESSSAEFFIE